MPRRKKETLYTKISPHIIPFFVGFSLFLSLFFISLKIYEDNILPVDQEKTTHTPEQIHDQDILARTVHWKTYDNSSYYFSLRYPDYKLKNTNDAPLFAKAGLCTKKEVQALTLEPRQFNTESLPTEIYSDLLQVTVHAEKLKENVSLHEWFGTNCTESFYDKEKYEKKNTTFLNLPVITLKEKQKGDEEQYITKKYHIFVKRDTIIYIITTYYSFGASTDKDVIVEGERVLNDIIGTITFYK